MITTLEAFLDSCRNQPSDHIYHVFEHEIDDNIHAQIMCLAPSAAAEPVRCALNHLGVQHGIQSLVDY
jgi:hypothetical protein